ncbi:retrovirus-related pol polyprotein from transposon TNT 1-94 [Tanacetum coccineum]
MARRKGFDLSHVIVPIFDGENYDYWCVKMEILFDSLDVFDDVKNTFEEPNDTQKLIEEQMKDLKKKRSRIAAVLSYKEIRNHHKTIEEGVHPDVVAEEEVLEPDVVARRKEVFLVRVARMDTVRAIISLAGQKGWLLYQLDVKSAFLNGELKEEVYVNQPQGFEVEGKKKTFYKSEQTFNVKNKGTSDILIVVLYVDDIAFTGNNKKMIEDFKNEMMQKYEMSDLGLLNHFLEMEIYQDEGGIFACQEKYVEKIMRNFDMSKCKLKDTPLVVNEALIKEDGSSKVDATLYRSLMGKLLYLTDTRPDIIVETVEGGEYISN